MERSGASAGRGGRAFEDIFQLVVVIFIQTPGREKFPRALQLAGHEAIIRTGVRLQGQTAVSPELPLGAETMGRLEQSDQDRKSTRLNSSHRCISYAVFCLKKKKYNI